MAAGGPGAGRLLVVGAGSFIARYVLGVCQEPISAVGYHAIDRPDLFDGVDRVISCARHPLLGSEHYQSRQSTPMCGSRSGSRGAISTT
jgi:hypothetical protein